MPGHSTARRSGYGRQGESALSAIASTRNLVMACSWSRIRWTRTALTLARRYVLSPTDARPAHRSARGLAWVDIAGWQQVKMS
jgi:hypothetical protein